MTRWVAEPVPVEAVIPLRHEILRADAPLETAHFEGDDHPCTLHVAVMHQGSAVGVGSIMPEVLPGNPSDRPARIRGMAVATDRRGLGIGTLVLDALLAHVRSAGADIAWCHARLPATSLYERAGFVPVSEVFQSPGIGPHVTMVLSL